ncbi:hypothetical protein QQF64_014144 [Cirrhinus molitorella]|uniref:Uncharacterized protein n=1 Tax=Cirrhinus molitorella TaxID=172907 RepID=A0ABR3LXC9_9TELE
MFRVSGGFDVNRDKGRRRRERQERRRCFTGLQGASSTARGKSTQCPSSSHTRHSVEKRKRERGVLVFPASISIKSQPLQSERRKSQEAVRAAAAASAARCSRGFAGI